MPLLYIAVIDLCFILDVDVPLICALITAVYRILTFIEKRFDQRETRHYLQPPSTVNNGAAMYPKIVKSNRGKLSVATSIQQTFIKIMYAKKNVNIQKIVSHQMKSIV